jgi:iron complex transport system substrate-binding protein
MRSIARVALAGLLLLAACRGGSETGGSASAPASNAATSPAVGVFPRRVVDGAGRALVLAAPPRRIVSQTLFTDEVLFAIVDPTRIVGVSTLARDPAYSNVVAQATKLGAPPIHSAEQVMTLHPDLIFVATFSRAEIVATLEQSGAPVYRTSSFDRMEDVRANIRRIGEIVGAETAAAALVDTMDRRLAAVAARRAGLATKPRVLSYDPSGFSAGIGTTFDDIVRAAGGVNVLAEAGIKAFPRISAEQVLAWQPDVIVCGVNRGEREGVLRAFQDNPALAATRAVKAGRVVILDNHALLAVSHYIVDAVEALADALDKMPLDPARGDKGAPR